VRPVHVGCSGWNYRDWRGRLYPPSLPAPRWLECYATHFGTVEVNTTFYRLVSRDAVEHWLAQTPDSFLFSVKASRYMTHVRRLRDVEQGIARFYERLEPLQAAGRLGAVLWQLPENLPRDDERLGALLAHLPDGRHAIEPRHPSWFAGDVAERLRERGVSLVVADHRERKLPTPAATADWRYIRFHFGTRGRRGNYSHAELEAWASRLHGWRAEQELYVYFNNDWEGFAPRNAMWLARRLEELARPARRPRSRGRT